MFRLVASLFASLLLVSSSAHASRVDGAHTPFVGAVASSEEPIVLVHGLGGSPSEFDALVEHLGRDRAVYRFSYPSMDLRATENGERFADDLRALADRLGSGHELTIIAHSLGGIIARDALNQLAFGRSRGIERFRRVHLIAIDTPWHGYEGPSDRGADRALMRFADVVLPPGLHDMRARAALFAGDPDSTDPVRRRGLLDPILPDHVDINLVFADQGDDVFDYREAFLRALAGQLVAHFRDDSPVRGEPRLLNFWKALVSAESFVPFANELRELADRQALDEKAVFAALERHYPILAGNHTSILTLPPGGRPTLADYLTRDARRTETTSRARALESRLE